MHGPFQHCKFTNLWTFLALQVCIRSRTFPAVYVYRVSDLSCTVSLPSHWSLRTESQPNTDLSCLTGHPKSLVHLHSIVSPSANSRSEVNLFNTSWSYHIYCRLLMTHYATAVLLETCYCCKHVSRRWFSWKAVLGTISDSSPPNGAKK